MLGAIFYLPCYIGLLVLKCGPKALSMSQKLSRKGYFAQTPPSHVKD